MRGKRMEALWYREVQEERNGLIIGLVRTGRIFGCSWAYDRFWDMFLREVPFDEG